MRFESPLREAKLLKRYKRFLADVVFPDGTEATAHCANPGSMEGVCQPGSRVYVSESSNPARKLRYTLEAIRVNRRWVGIHPVRGNHVVEEALNRDLIPELSGFSSMQREPRHSDGSRSDFLLRGQVPVWVEVKYVTLARGPVAYFPDSVSVRATRHVETLERIAAKGERGVILFVTPRSDVNTIRPADSIDPAFGRALRRASGRGLEVLGYRIRVSRRGLVLGDSVSVDLKDLAPEASSPGTTVIGLRGSSGRGL